MVCKESVNLTREQKKWEAAGADSHPMPGPVSGEGAGRNARQCTTTRRECNKRLFDFGFPNKPPLSVQAHPSFGNHRTDLNRISVHTAADRGSLAGLLVQRGQSRFIGGFQRIILSPTIRANLDPCATQARVHSADGSSSICFLPHIASPTSPVKVRLPLARA